MANEADRRTIKATGRQRQARVWRLRLLALIALVAAALPGLIDEAGRQAAGAGERDLLDVKVSSRWKSGIAGHASLEQLDGYVRLTLTLRGIPEDAAPLPAMIHAGDCRTPEPMPLFPLTPVSPQSGSSETVLETTLAELIARPRVVVIQRPAAALADLSDPRNIVACGVIGTGSKVVDGEVIGPPDTGVGTWISDPAATWFQFGLAAVAALLAVAAQWIRMTMPDPQ